MVRPASTSTALDISTTLDMQYAAPDAIVSTETVGTEAVPTALIEHAPVENAAGELIIFIERLENISAMELPNMLGWFTMSIRCGAQEHRTELAPKVDLGPHPLNSWVASLLASCACIKHGNTIVWNERVAFHLTAHDLATALVSDGREAVELCVIGSPGRSIGRERVVAACRLRFLHLESTTRIFARMDDKQSSSADSDAAAVPGVWLSIRWEPSPSWDSSALHGALLRELGAQGERANEAERAKYRRPLRLRS